MARTSSSSKTSGRKKPAPQTSKPKRSSKKAPASRPAKIAAEPELHVSSHDRERMVQYAAYHIAEKDGFKQGKEQDYWFEAEKQISELLKGQPSTSKQAH